MNSRTVSRLRAAKGLSRLVARCFASLSMTGLDLAVGEELSRSFEPCLSVKRVMVREKRSKESSTQKGAVINHLYGLSVCFTPFHSDSQRDLGQTRKEQLGK